MGSLILNAALDPRLTDGDFRTLAVLVAIGFGEIAQADLARDRKTNLRTVARHLSRLRELGYIEVYRDEGRVNGYKPGAPTKP